MKLTKENTEQLLLAELSNLIEQSQQQVVAQANSTLTLLFWQVGHRINQNILQNKRAEYGTQIVSTVSTQLEKAYGKNFTEKNVRRMKFSRFSNCRYSVTTIELVAFSSKSAKCALK